MAYEDDPANGTPQFPEQFGDIGAEIAQIAEVLIDYFSGEPEDFGDGSQGMPDSDHEALGYWLSMESVAPIMDVPYEVDGGTRRQVYDTWVAFHTALPFNEAERQWLDEMSRRVRERLPGDFPRFIEGYEDQIVMAG